MEITGGKISLSKGLINSLSRQFSSATEADRKRIYQMLLLAPSMHTDFTPGRVNGKTVQVLICTNPYETLYCAREHKGHEGIKGSPVEKYLQLLIHAFSLFSYLFLSVLRCTDRIYNTAVPLLCSLLPAFLFVYQDPFADNSYYTVLSWADICHFFSKNLTFLKSFSAQKKHLKDHSLRCSSHSICKTPCTFKTTYKESIHPSLSPIPLWLCPRPISNSQLHVLPHFHLCPIYLVVFKGSY